MRIPIISSLTDAIWGKPQDMIPEEMYLPSPIPLPNLAEFSTPEFQEPFYRQASLNMQVESKNALILSVQESHLSLRCKKAWLNIIETYYDRNILLSDLTGKKIQKGSSSDEQVQIAYWRAKIDIMGVVRCNAYKSDRINPEFTRIEQLVLSQIWYRLKRTKGIDRERMASGRIQISYNSKQTVGKAGGPEHV